MLKLMTDLPSGVVGVEASGTVTRQDYEKVMEPLFKKAYEKGERLRFLYRFGPEFKGFSAGAAWEDARLGLRYLKLFERCAIATDAEWLRASTKAAAFLMPCPVRCFSLKETPAAITWVNAVEPPHALGIDLLTEKGVLVLEPHGSLQVADFDRLASFVDPWIEQHHQLQGLVLNLHGFPGWDDFTAFERHFHFVRNHHKHVTRIAVVGDGLSATLLPQFAAFFIDSKVKSFDQDEFDDAVVWAASSKRGSRPYDNKGRSSAAGRREVSEDISQ